MERCIGCGIPFSPDMDIRMFIEKGIPIPLGNQGESGVISRKFGYGDFVEDYGDGILTILHQRAGDESPQSVTITTEDNTAIWDITETDTEYAGMGRIQIVYTAMGVTKKTMTGTTIVEPSL